MTATIRRIGPLTEDWLDTLVRCARTVGVTSYDDCELAYIYDRWCEGASPYAVGAELWGKLEGNDNGQ